jgi:hypothetical protein
MKSRLGAALLAVVALLTARSGSAAILSSTRPTLEPRIGNLLLFTSSRQQGVFIRNDGIYAPPIEAHVASTTITVDTVADTGFVADLDFTPVTAPQQTFGNAYDIDFEVILVPANFPDPAVTRHVVGDYEERITISSVTSQDPQLLSSETSGISAVGTTDFFSMFNSLQLSQASFMVHGTYEVFGPTQNVSVPFSVEYRTSGMPAFGFMQTFIRGGPGFGAGFEFDPRELRIEFHAVNPVIFNGTVEDVPFRAEFNSIAALRYFVPEPATAGVALVLGAAGFGLGRARRRRL